MCGHYFRLNHPRYDSATQAAVFGIWVAAKDNPARAPHFSSAKFLHGADRQAANTYK
jgi:hypothetical protein